MDEKMFTDFFIGKWKWNLYVIQDLYYVYVAKAFIATLDWKA